MTVINFYVSLPPTQSQKNKDQNNNDLFFNQQKFPKKMKNCVNKISLQL